MPPELWQFQPCELPVKLTSKTSAPIIGKSKERFDPDAGVGQATTAAPAATAATNAGGNDATSESDSVSNILSGSNAKPPAIKTTRFASKEQVPASRRVSHSTAKVPRSQLKQPPADPRDESSRREHDNSDRRERRKRDEIQLAI